ncbi:hypothetical protein HGI30_15755 [Paenibacillus albicereus]|uniref:Uncharacterized protein n=1 Tax=Paenibacillus albicereus TaxID=2726185 RepID=A0A6H2H0D3_9BACL|nr:hypothetical protein [Paenibacillus albicereus]QJC52876.1 hypothetical protein HGI30_15755 [Paenibacillus albicereus]
MDKRSGWMAEIASLYGGMTEQEREKWRQTAKKTPLGLLPELESGDWSGWEDHRLEALAGMLRGFVLTVRQVPDILEAAEAHWRNPLPRKIEFGFLPTPGKQEGEEE